MTVWDAGWVRPEPSGSAVLGLGVSYPCQWYIYGEEEFGVTVGALVPSRPCGSQADGGTLGWRIVPWRVVSGPPSAGPVLCWKHAEMAKALTLAQGSAWRSWEGSPGLLLSLAPWGTGDHLGNEGTGGSAQGASRLGDGCLQGQVPRVRT